MFTTLIAAALAAAAPAAAPAADPHAGHHPAGHQDKGHEGKGCCDHKMAEGKTMECCKDKAEADKATCCAGHGRHADDKK
jgi:hypothetical protein